MDRGRYILQLLEKKDYEADKVTQNDDDNSSMSRFFNDKNLCESAPQSINTTYINNNTYKDLASIEQPKSAPLPTNIPNDLLSLQDIVEENLNLQDNESHSNKNGPPSPYSYISGVEPLSSSPRPNPFSDSSDSWIPNSDEEPYVRNISVTILSSSDKSDDIEHTKFYAKLQLHALPILQILLNV
ncbi:unnamed protein product [Arctia plantaginis]|uniref:Uncharacterized protein n=1 Tax=Arctia plantaginis TaxID=874455 RepID=A0A8S1AI58_ARCPL|nr:unnamed protein product [Arctia plantaginis]